MATNKTEHYGLHIWEAGDDFLRREFNENFARLDEAANIVIGSYTGDGEKEREIVLGFMPRAVFFCNYRGGMGYGNFVYGGLFLPGQPLTCSGEGTAAEITQTGFRLYANSYKGVNSVNTPYYYLILR